MLSIPEDIKELFRKDNRVKETARHLKLYFFEEKINLLFPEDSLFPSDELFPVDMEPYYVIEDIQIVSETMKITESLCESEDLKFGECNATQFEITVADVFQDLTGLEFLATIEIGGYELALGIYKVDSFVRQADRRKKKITAYNRIKYFHVDVAEWYRSLNFPLTLKEFRTSLCDYVGVVEINQTLPLDHIKISETIEPEQISGIDVIQAICEINGCFGQVDKTGRMKYVFLEHTGLFPSEKLFPEDNIFPADALDSGGELLTHYKQSGTTYEDYIVDGIDRIKIRQEEGDVGESFPRDIEGENVYVIQGNFLAYGKNADELSEIARSAFDKMSKKTYRPCCIVSPALPWVEVGDILVCYTSDDAIETFCMKRTMSGCQSMTDTYESTGGKERGQSFGIQTSILQLEGKAAVIKKSVEEVSVRITDLKEYTEAQFEITDQKISAKVSKGQVSSELSIEPDKVILRGNRLIVESTNFKLDENGNGTFSGNVTGANISGGAITGTTIEGGTRIPFKATRNGVYLGDFYVGGEYGRHIFQSVDEVTGMSAGTSSARQLYLWAGWGKASGGDAVFLVNGNQVHIWGELYVNGNKITGSGSGGGPGCTNDSVCKEDGACPDYCDCNDSGGDACGPGDT